MFSGSYLRWKEAHEFYIKGKKNANFPLLIDFYRGVNGVALMKKKFLFNHSWALKKIILIYHQCTVCHTWHFDADNTHVLVVLKMYYFFHVFTNSCLFYFRGVSLWIVCLDEKWVFGSILQPSQWQQCIFLCFICGYIIMLHLYVCAKFGEYWRTFRGLN